MGFWKYIYNKGNRDFTRGMLYVGYAAGGLDIFFNAMSDNLGELGIGLILSSLFINNVERRGIEKALRNSKLDAVYDEYVEEYTASESRLLSFLVDQEE